VTEAVKLLAESHTAEKRKLL